MEIIREFERYTKEEMDFEIEGKHIGKFYRLFGGNDHIVIPKYFQNFSSKRVLVMGYLGGRKLSELLHYKVKFNKKAVADALFDFSLRQIFQKNIFHADLHPGNVIFNKGKVQSIYCFINEGADTNFTTDGIEMNEEELEKYKSL